MIKGGPEAVPRSSEMMTDSRRIESGVDSDKQDLEPGGDNIRQGLVPGGQNFLFRRFERAIFRISQSW